MHEFSPFSLEGKTILITGASSGIGRSCAIACSKLGARVILMGRNSERLQETHSHLKAEREHIALSIELTNYLQVDEVLKKNSGSIGKVNGIIHCAGISTTLPLRMITPEKLDLFYKTNVVSAINLTRLLTKPTFLPDDGCSIVFLSSVMGVAGEAGKLQYSLTKGALISGARSLAVELAPKGIRVNCILPGVVVTPMTANANYSQDEELLNKIKSYHPLGLGKPEDIANGCIYLLSDASRWVTGSNLIIDGGYTAR